MTPKKRKLIKNISLKEEDTIFMDEIELFNRDLYLTDGPNSFMDCDE